MAGSIVFVDGEIRQGGSIPVSDGGFLFGDSLFETMLVRERKIRFRADHLDRMEFSATFLDFPFDRSAVETALDAVLAHCGDAPLRLRLTISRGDFDSLALPSAGRMRIVVTARPYAEPTDDERRAGVRCVIAPNQRVNPLSHLPQMKRGNYADSLYAADHARRLGAREALFIDGHGRVLEGATTNLFIVRAGTLLTPAAGELVLPGVMRRQVLLAAAALGVPTRERDIFLDELRRADEAFLTNALCGILPLNAVEDQPLPTGPLALTLWAGIETAATPQTA